MSRRAHGPLTQPTPVRGPDLARLRRRTTILVAGAVVAVLAMTGVAPATPTAAQPVPDAVLGSAPARAAGSAAAAERAFGAMPVAFVPNRGQTDPEVRYYAVGGRFAFLASRDELMLSLSKRHAGRHLALALRFLDRSPRATITADHKAAATRFNAAGNGSWPS